MKTCKQCGMQKPFDRGVKKNSKDSGFMGALCWECFKDFNKLAQRKFRSTPEGLEASRESKRKHLANPENRAKANASSVKYSMKRRKVDGWFRLRRQLAKDTRYLLKRLAQGRGTDYACIKLFGASRAATLAYFDEQLETRGWTWADVQSGTCQVDHRQPLGLAQDDLELRTLCLLPNLQLLTPEENAIKAIVDRGLILR